MCGIAAITSNIGSTKYEINLMINRIAHRGETDPQIVEFDSFQIANTRLKIVDPDGSKQPIFNENGTVAVIFNGEIYNFKELREHLQNLGHKFKTNGDTEILVHLYESYGTEFFKMLDGMFAFIIFDKMGKKFVAVRDYFGVKPLFYAKKNDVYYFSSEIKSFIDLGFEAVYEIEPGCYLINGQMIRYYDIPKDIDRNIEFNQAVEKVRSLVEKAVSKRVQTDLPIGVFFGGGIDSTIVLLLSMKYHKNVTPIIIGDEKAEDVIFAKRFCNERNIPHLYFKTEPTNLISLIPKIVYVTESFEPNVIKGSVFSYLLSKFAAVNNFKIILCGEGSDEIFAGYGDFLSMNENEIQDFSYKILSDLHRTQLLRVDRTSMAFTIEVREPLLDRSLVEYAMSLPPHFKVARNENGRLTTKYILREAFKDILPDYIYKREKMTLMYGAGLGKVNVDGGLFYDYAENEINNDEFDKWKLQFSDYSLKTKEDVLYFRIFSKYYLNAKFMQKRPYHSKKEIVATNYENCNK